MFVNSEMLVLRHYVHKAINEQATEGLSLKVRDDFSSELGELMVFKFSISWEIRDQSRA